MTRPSRDEWFSDMARLVARRATCLRRSVGCVLVSSKGHVIATGYNGVARGLPHCNEEKEVGRAEAALIEIGALEPHPEHPNACAAAGSPSGANLDGCEAIHAEQNALLQCRNVEEISACYVTVSPCVTCVKLLMNTACRRIIAAERYAHDAAAKRLWEAVAGREWVVLSDGAV